jgi:hypothetical protein
MMPAAERLIAVFIVQFWKPLNREPVEKLGNVDF